MKPHSILLSLLLLLGCTTIDSGSANNKTLFAKLSTDHTGITFNNALEDHPDHNIMIYSNYYGGAGVGIGDLNNDGLQDIYFAGNLVGDELYLNQGELQFKNITSRAGIENNGGWSSGVLIADVNQDGHNDIYVTRELYDDQPNLRRNLLYINDGNEIPSFTEQAVLYGVDDNGRTRHATFIDYDKDGDLDLYLLNQPPNPGDYSPYYDAPLLIPEYGCKLLEYTGTPGADGQSGGFIDVTQKSGLDRTGYPNSVTASDLNGDGWTDLYVANDFEVGDWYYINNGDGTFSDRLTDLTMHTSYFGMGVDASDINNDGHLDLAVVDMAAEDNYRSKANMSGMNPKAFWQVVDNGGHYQYMFNTLQMNSGGGHLSDIAQLAGMATTDWSWSILMADFDNDQYKDVFISNGLYRDIRNKDASKKFKEYVEGKLYDFVKDNPDVGDKVIWDIVDIDSTLAMVPSVKLQNFIYKNNGDLSFTKKIKDWGISEKTFSNGASYADLDNDGDLDLVINNINDPAGIYKNTSSDNQQSNYLRINPVPPKGKSSQGVKCWVRTDDQEQFAEVSSVRGMYSTSESTLHFGLSQNKNVKEIRLQWTDGKVNILSGIPANQSLDILYTDALERNPTSKINRNPLLSESSELLKSPIRHKENKFDDYKTQVLLPHKMSTSGPSMTSGDINGDGLEDVFIGGAINQAGTILLQQSDGTFHTAKSAALNADTKHEDLGAELFDADGDGDLDLYVVSGGNEARINSPRYEDRLYINDGNGNFNKENNRLPKLSISGSKVRSADFDKDGDLDLFVAGRHIPWAYPEPANSVILVNERGVFSIADDDISRALQGIGMINDARWTDIDNDGWEDIVVAGEWMPITILQNNQGKSFSKSTIQTNLPTEGWWWSIQTADMDGDGDNDIIAGNLGLNYKYKASPTEPFEVYYHDFDNNKSKDIVLTYYNYGIQYPLRGKQCSSEQIPELNDKIPTYDLFASSDVNAIYGAEDLDKALHLKAYTFGSSYFENLGNGKFKQSTLQNQAQVSSVNDILVDDYNNDGHQDILIAGNLYNAEVETARNDAGFGLLLIGNSKGDFEAMPRNESGFFVPYNVKSLANVKGRSNDFIFVGSNNEELKVFKKESGQ